MTHDEHRKACIEAMEAVLADWSRAIKWTLIGVAIGGWIAIFLIAIGVK